MSEPREQAGGLTGAIAVPYCRPGRAAGASALARQRRASGGPEEASDAERTGEGGLKERPEKILDSADYAARLGVSPAKFKRAQAYLEHSEKPPDRPWVAKLARRIAPPTRYVGSGLRRRTPVWLLSDVEAFEEKAFQGGGETSEG